VEAKCTQIPYRSEKGFYDSSDNSEVELNKPTAKGKKSEKLKRRKREESLSQEKGRSDKEKTAVKGNIRERRCPRHFITIEKGEAE